MASPKDSNDSYVKRNAMSNVTAGGKKVFRTAVFGYNKVAVNDYIDKLYSEYSEGEKALTSEIAKLREVNAELEKRSTDVDSRFEEVRAQVTSELAFVSEFHDQEDEYNRRIEELKKETDSLQEKVKAGDELNSSLLQRLESSINRADDLQRTLDAQNSELSVLRRDKEFTGSFSVAAPETVVSDLLNDKITELTSMIQGLQKASESMERTGAYLTFQSAARRRSLRGMMRLLPLRSANPCSISRSIRPRLNPNLKVRPKQRLRQAVKQAETASFFPNIVI